MPTSGGLDIPAEAAVAAGAEVLGVMLPPRVLAFSDLHLLGLAIIRHSGWGIFNVFRRVYTGGFLDL